MSVSVLGHRLVVAVVLVAEAVEGSGLLVAAELGRVHAPLALVAAAVDVCDTENRDGYGGKRCPHRTKTDTWSYCLTSASKFNIDGIFDVRPENDRASPNVKTP